MVTKNFFITLDMVLPLPFHPFEVVEGDTGNILHVTLKNNGAPLDLIGCDVMVVFASNAGSAIQDVASGLTIESEPGTFTLSLLPGSYGPGNVQADVQVYSGTDRATLVTSKRFDFRCRRTLISEEIMHANATYPPLIRATHEAEEATNAAYAAIATIDTSIGELNVQSDWTETDTDADAYIKNRPSAFSPIAHASVHAATGADPVTPAAIGAEKQRLQFENVVVPVASFVADATYADYGYRADIALTGVLPAMTPEVVFALLDAVSGTFAPIAVSYDGGISIYASEIPQTAVLIPTVILWKAVSA